MPQADAPLVVPPEGGIVYRPEGSTLLAGAGDTGGAFGLLAVGPMPRGRWVPAHTHRAAAEAWYVLEQAQRGGDAGQYSTLDAETLTALARKYGIEFVD
jgi:hypothetical protein